MGSEANNYAVWGQISVLSAMLRKAIYSGEHRNATTYDYEVEMELDAERRRLTSTVTTLSICSDTVEQRMIHGGSNDERLTNADSKGTSTTSFMPICVAALVSYG